MSHLLFVIMEHYQIGAALQTIVSLFVNAAGRAMTGYAASDMDLCVMFLPRQVTDCQPCPSGVLSIHWMIAWDFSG
jgi:hypothetical protein